MGGVRDRNKLERAADAYSTVISLQGPRATANALRGLAYTRMWLNRSEAEAFEPLETGLKNGVWVTRGQYPGEVDRALASAPYPSGALLQQAACIPSILESRSDALVEEAEALCRRALAVDPGDVDALSQLLSLCSI